MWFNSSGSGCTVAFWDCLTRGISNWLLGPKNKPESHRFRCSFFCGGVTDLRGDVPAITLRAKIIKCHSEGSGEAAGGL